MKGFTVAILGCGSRGAETYGRIMQSQSEKYKIVALCEKNEERLNKYSDIFEVEKQNCFTLEEDFFSKKRADLIVIATQDADHVRHCISALQLGYDVLLEKPITSSREECEKLLLAQETFGGKVLVCHVLRYAPAFIKVKELITAGEIGSLVSIQALEQINYWHIAHSYVRGNWRDTTETSPTILAKCCHDLDLLQYYAGAKAKSVSSMGCLFHFKKQNAPKDCAIRCLDCKYVNDCPYSAKRIYIDRWKETGSLPNVWPFNVLTSEIPLTEENLFNAIKTGQYGRCVYYCDNNAVDNQITNVAFENGVTASLSMMGFTGEGGRIMRFFGTHGEIVLDECAEILEIKRYGKPKERLSLTTIAEVGHSHGGGDDGLVTKLYEILNGKVNAETSLTASVESHLIGIAAEKSRLNGGELIKIR